ncbi:hypothetical protein L2E82_15599 [Cichorium intybus]|uniref:Uncharacterized protein n=1 Tax=Cichorium intybus TaxID=13427 RepID=A0ACB9F3N2_CICIN|nr:hypothetical protein L2E82_15599 [Cichorium intybus]
MVRAPYFDKNGLKKGAWSENEDQKLRAYIEKHGNPNWRKLPKLAGLSRCGKSCRLRWMNYLHPDIKRGNYTVEEEDLIIKLHHSLGNKWSKIAAKLPGRSDNEIKNHWHTHLSKRVNQKPTASYPGNELVRNPKCSKEKGILKVSDLKDRDEVELLLAVLSSESLSNANNEQSSSSSSVSSLDQVGWDGYSPQPLNEEPVKDFWRMENDIFMEPLDVLVNKYDDSSTCNDMILIDDCLWPSMEFHGHDTRTVR